VSNTRYILDEANGIHPRTASCAAQERCVQQRLGRGLKVHPLFLFFSFFQLSKTHFYLFIDYSVTMCDYMYYEELRKHKVKKHLAEPEPELEQQLEEEKPVVIKA
jgi:hypothetical protein